MRSLILRRHEAERLAKHGEVLVVRKVKLTDPSGTYACHDDAPGFEGWPLSATEYGDWPRDSSPFGRVGETLWTREQFLACKGSSQEPRSIEDATYVCFRDGSQKLRSGEYHPWTQPVNQDAWPSWARFRSPATMPRWASRFNVRVESVECRRLQSVTEDEAKRAGHEGVPYKDGRNVNHDGHRAEMARSLGPDAWRHDDWHWFGVMRRA